MGYPFWWFYKPCYRLATMPGRYCADSYQKCLIMPTQDYQVLIQKVTMYLDNELNEQEERKLLQDIQSNPNYFKVLSKEKSFREFIKNKIHRRKPSPALIQSIKERIRVNPSNQNPAYSE